MKTIVVDASVVASWFLPDEKSGSYADMYKRMDDYEINAPQFIYYELSNILIQAIKKGRINQKALASTLDILWKLPVHIDILAPLEAPSYFEGIVNTALARNLTSYDSTYLELAVRLGKVHLATYDKELSSAARKLGLKGF